MIVRPPLNHGQTPAWRVTVAVIRSPVCDPGEDFSGNGSLRHNSEAEAIVLFRKPRIPKQTDFPSGTEFVIKEFDLPLAAIPDGKRRKWVNWFGGVPRPYDVTCLKVDNNWPADSFEEWAALIEASLPHNRRT